MTLDRMVLAFAGLVVLAGVALEAPARLQVEFFKRHRRFAVLRQFDRLRWPDLP